MSNASYNLIADLTTGKTNPSLWLSEGTPATIYTAAQITSTAGLTWTMPLTGGGWLLCGTAVRNGVVNCVQQYNRTFTVDEVREHSILCMRPCMSVPRPSLWCVHMRAG